MIAQKEDQLTEEKLQAEAREIALQREEAEKMKKQIEEEHRALLEKQRAEMLEEERKKF